jgi:hypothetical protein
LLCGQGQGWDTHCGAFVNMGLVVFKKVSHVVLRLKKLL